MSRYEQVLSRLVPLGMVAAAVATVAVLVPQGPAAESTDPPAGSRPAASQLVASP